ncbi:MAG: hypothetical protein Q4F95_08530 [Oscillospiraceae bacterium]|nr:hypothetical protein [Oscillospiraceae bacterium]
MKRLTIIIIMLISAAALAGCGHINDELFYDKRKNAEFVILKCADDYLWSDNWREVLFNSVDDLGIESGEFALVKADITVYNGGVAGYMNNPHIDEIKSIEKISLDEVIEYRTIPDVSESDFTFDDSVIIRRCGGKTYYFVSSRGKYYAFLEGKCLGVYEDETILECCRILYNGELTWDDLKERISSGKMQGDDYFLMSDKSDNGTFVDDLCYIDEKIKEVVISREYKNAGVNQRADKLEPILKELRDDGKINMYNIFTNTEQPYVELWYNGGVSEKIIL